MDGGDCVNKSEHSVDMEEGELEDGELDDTVDDVPPAEEFDQSHVESVSQSPSCHDRKKKSKKRKREEADKAYHISSDHQRKSINDCDTDFCHDGWIGNDSSFGRNTQNKTSKGSHDSPCSSAEECGDERRYHGQNDAEMYEPPHRMRRHSDKRRGRRKGKKAKKSVGNDETDDRKYDVPKSFRHLSNKRNKFSSADKVPICKYFLEGKCFKGDECAFSHCTQFQKKAELCRHYLTGSCKKTSCQFYHGDWPCRDYHLRGGCEDGEFCKFSHDELTEETESLLCNPVNNAGDCRRPMEDFQRQSHEDRKKIPSLLDIEIFPPGHVPKRPSPSHRGGYRGIIRPNRALKFAKGQKKGTPGNAPFSTPNFGVDNPNVHSNDYMKQDNSQKQRQGWGRKPYGADWYKKDSYHEEPNQNEAPGTFKYFGEPLKDEFNFGKDMENNDDDPSSSQQDQTDESEKFNLSDKWDHVSKSHAVEGEENVVENSEDDACKTMRCTTPTDQNYMNICASSTDFRQPVQQQVKAIQNINNVQVANMLGMTRSILRIPPPNIMPMQCNVIRGVNRINSTSCPQPGILGAPPVCGPILQNPIQHGMASNPPRHVNMPHHQGIQTPQILNQFVPPQQPLAGIMGRNARGMFPSNIPPVNTQPFLHLPPFPPPRFDFNQIISNIVRNTLNTQSPMFLVNTPSPVTPPVINGSCMPVAEAANSVQNEDKSRINMPSNTNNNLSLNNNNNNNTNNNLSLNNNNNNTTNNLSLNNSNNTNNNTNNNNNIKPGVDPRLKNKEDKVEVAQEEDSKQDSTFDVEETEITDEGVLEVDGTSKQVEYCLRPLALNNYRPCIPIDVLMSLKDDIASCEDPRLKSYSRSLSELKFDNVNKLEDPRSHVRRENKNLDIKKSTFSPPSLLSPTDSSTSKPYTLPDIFIPPTSAPNIELEEKALSGANKIRHRKNSGSLFSPSRDLSNFFSDFTCQQEMLQLEASISQNPPGSMSPPAGSSIKLSGKGQKKIVDYRNDPRFKKKKLGTKTEEEPTGIDKCDEPITSSLTALNTNSSSSKEPQFVKPATGHKSIIPRIPSPNPTFPRYCTNFEPNGLYMSNSTEELDDVDDYNDDAIQCKEREANNVSSPHTSSMSGLAPFLPGEQSPGMMEEINLKDMFKTIDPTTSPFC